MRPAPALAALAAYLSSPARAVAAERSFLMLGVMLLAVIFDRAALTMRNLAIAAIVIIALSPHEVAGPELPDVLRRDRGADRRLRRLGGAAFGDARRRRSRSRPSLRSGPRKSGGYVLAPGDDLADRRHGDAVFGAYHFQRVSPLGLAANLAAMPIVSLVVMPFAVIGVVLMPFGLDGWALPSWARASAR